MTNPIITAAKEAFRSRVVTRSDVSEHTRNAQAIAKAYRVLREQRGNRGLKFNDDQRRRLAAKAKKLGRTTLGQVATIADAAVLNEPAQIPAGDRAMRHRGIASS